MNGIAFPNNQVTIQAVCSCVIYYLKGFVMKGRSHAKIQAVLSEMKEQSKIQHKTVMLSDLQLV